MSDGGVCGRASGPWPAVDKLIHKKKEKKKKEKKQKETEKETEKRTEKEERQERAVSASSDDDRAGAAGQEAPGCMALVAAVRRRMHACLPSLRADARCVFLFIDVCVCVCVCVCACVCCVRELSAAEWKKKEERKRLRKLERKKRKVSAPPPRASPRRLDHPIFVPQPALCARVCMPVQSAHAHGSHCTRTHTPACLCTRRN